VRLRPSPFTSSREDSFSESHVVSEEECWAETYTLHGDGAVEKTFHEVISEEAKRIRKPSLRPTPASSSAPEPPKGRSPRWVPALVGVLQEVHQEVNQHDDDDEPHQEPYYVLHVSSSTTCLSFTLDPGCLNIVTPGCFTNHAKRAGAP